MEIVWVGWMDCDHGSTNRSTEGQPGSSPFKGGTETPHLADLHIKMSSGLISEWRRRVCGCFFVGVPPTFTEMPQAPFTFSVSYRCSCLSQASREVGSSQREGTEGDVLIER